MEISELNKPWLDGLGMEGGRHSDGIVLFEGIEKKKKKKKTEGHSFPNSSFIIRG